MGWADGIPSFNSQRYFIFQKYSELSRGDTSKLLLFADVAPGNICYSSFVIRMGPEGQFYHLPSTSHDKFGPLSFADGHIESQKWLEPETLAKSRIPWLPNHWTVWVPGSRDLTWLQDHASILKPEYQASPGN
jgi:hypothetical protein